MLLVSKLGLSVLKSKGLNKNKLPMCVNSYIYCQWNKIGNTFRVSMVANKHEPENKHFYLS